MARETSKKYQITDNTNSYYLKSGQLLGHPITPNNPTFEYRKGDVVDGVERRLGVGGKNWILIQVGYNKYIPLKKAIPYRGGKPRGGRNFSGADGNTLTKNQEQRIQNIQAIQMSVGLLGSIAGVIYSSRTGGGFWRGVGYWVVGGLVFGIPTMLITTPLKNRILKEGDKDSGKTAGETTGNIEVATPMPRATAEKILDMIKKTPKKQTLIGGTFISVLDKGKTAPLFAKLKEGGWKLDFAGNLIESSDILRT